MPTTYEILAADRMVLREALSTIRANAKSQLDGMNSMGTPDDAPERIAALWYYTEATAALMR